MDKGREDFHPKRKILRLIGQTDEFTGTWRALHTLRRAALRRVATVATQMGILAIVSLKEFPA